MDASSNITADIGDIQISQEPVSPNPTSTVELNVNLSSNSIVPAAFSTTDPTSTSDFSAGVTIYDSLGNSHLLSIYFRKSATNTWSWYALANGSEVTGSSATSYYQGGTGTMTFTTAGGLQSVTTTSSYFSFIGAGVSQAVSFDFGTFATATATGALDGVTQFGSDSAISNITQDGFASGSLKSIDISTEGIITGNYTNGTNQQLGQIVLATFNSQSGLSRTGSSNYRETLESGLATLSAPQTTGKGSIVASTLEQSNVDLANELIKMVIIQRGFQANTRTIGTINDMLAQLVTLGQG
ncbi:MAG: flagellar hook-basal body complex protein [Deltaproteobacteria bacterium]|nr:MAG: flagellar hook-basal body complex protein [Deltaproteobacteria bacterium]